MGRGANATGSGRVPRRQQILVVLARGAAAYLPQASSDWINNDIPRLGAAVAFYTLLSLAPVIVITVALAAVFYGQEAAEGRLAAEIRGMGGPELARTIQEIIKGGHQPRIGAITTLFGLATLAFGASSVFVELRDAIGGVALGILLGATMFLGRRVHQGVRANGGVSTRLECWGGLAQRRRGGT